MRRHLMAIMAVLLLVSHATADLYTPNRALFVIRTEFFDIIFPNESRSAAEYLSEFADETYAEIASLLETTPRIRLAVVITPDSEQLNGYYTSWPYPRIVLYQAPVDLNYSLGSFRNDLYTVFYHELTHAVSLSIRDPVQEALVTVFGSPLGLSMYTTPLYFSEGVSVSFESLDGFGRTDDPLAAGILRQDILEGAFKTRQQVAGAWDRYPYSYYHVYGGYFSRWLQQRFGMERYAELWRHLGTGMIFKPLERGLFSAGHFFEVYGVEINGAWEEFKSSMAIKVPVYMDTRPIRPLSDARALASSGGDLYYADEASGTIYGYDTRTGLEQALFRTGYPVSRLDAAKDGSLLISTIRSQDGLPMLALLTWDAASRRLVDLHREGLRDAAWATEDKIVAIRVDGYQTDIVLSGLDGEKVLLPGSERVSYASPSISADGLTLYALARIDGTVSIIRMRMGGSGPFPVQRLVLPDGIVHVRYLSIAGETLYAAWDDGSLYRLIEIDGETIRYQGVPISGGVHRPVSAAGSIFYLGRFSGGSAPCAFPADRVPLAFSGVPAIWEDMSGLPPTMSVYDRERGVQAMPYSVLPWLLPRYWHPTFSVDVSGLTGAGAAFYIADPAERYAATVALGWDARASAADARFDLSWNRWAPMISIRLEDEFALLDALDPSGGMDRSSLISIGLADTVRSSRAGAFEWSVRTGLSAATLVDTARPYAPWSDAAVSTMAIVYWYDFRVPVSPHLSRYGYGLSLAGRADRVFLPALDEVGAGAEASIMGNLPWSGLGFRIDGAVGLSGSSAYGGDGYELRGFVRTASFPSRAEFSSVPAGRWYTQGEASLTPLSAEIQRGLWMLYANRLTVTAGTRACAVADAGMGAVFMDASAFGRLELTWTPVAGAFATIHPILGAELWYRMSDGMTGFSLSLEAGS
ncbi:MAG: hypothetical protein E4H20_01415 [Spirochaetales bacterium]|nr:MAG: hypothetical protein E4H20_01415 [Spirochaetales bacterium]